MPLSSRAPVLLFLLLLVGGCQLSGPSGAGWRGPNVHLVDGTWIGTETDCTNDADGLECRTVADLAWAALEPAVRNKAARIRLASLPTEYVTAAGEVRTARLTAGISTVKAVVIDQVDGVRRVIGLWCYLPYRGNGALAYEAATCTIAPLDCWVDGNAPPSYPPGTTFG